jgi:hypothetical protein
MMLEHADDLYFPQDDGGKPRATDISVTLPHALAILALVGFLGFWVWF